MAKKQSVKSGSGNHNSPPSHVIRGSRHITCPSCGAPRSYRLGDGRRKCGRCDKKFRPRRRNGKVDEATLRDLARLFWLMVPTERVAGDLGLNRKTAQAHFRHLREAIAVESWQALAQIGGELEGDHSSFGGLHKGKRGRGAGGKIPEFGLLKRGGGGVWSSRKVSSGPTCKALSKATCSPNPGSMWAVSGPMTDWMWRAPTTSASITARISAPVEPTATASRTSGPLPNAASRSTTVDTKRTSGCSSGRWNSGLTTGRIPTWWNTSTAY